VHDVIAHLPDIWQGSDAADVAHSAKWKCVNVEEPA
jgi:hypothetical protein